MPMLAKIRKVIATVKFVREQFYLAAVAQNLKRLVRFLNMRAQPAMAIA